MSAAFDAYRTTYEATVENSIAFSGLSHDFFIRAKVSLLAKLFDRHFGSARLSVLDVGCGVGVMHPHLLPMVGALSGTDVSSESLDRARQEHPNVDYRLQTGGVLPWADAAFDVTLAVCVFHHVPLADRPALVAHMRRLTRPGGLVVVIEHNPWNPLTRLAVARCPFDHDAALLSAHQARVLLRQGGLREIQTHFFLLFPFAADWAARLEGALRHAPLGAQFAAFGTV